MNRLNGRGEGRQNNLIDKHDKKTRELNYKVDIAHSRLWCRNHHLSLLKIFECGWGATREKKNQFLVVQFAFRIRRD